MKVQDWGRCEWICILLRSWFTHVCIWWKCIVLVYLIPAWNRQTVISMASVLKSNHKRTKDMFLQNHWPNLLSLLTNFSPLKLGFFFMMTMCGLLTNPFKLENSMAWVFKPSTEWKFSLKSIKWRSRLMYLLSDFSCRSGLTSWTVGTWKVTQR